jgi:hypothetical protein
LKYVHKNLNHACCGGEIYNASYARITDRRILVQAGPGQKYETLSEK